MRIVRFILASLVMLVLFACGGGGGGATNNGFTLVKPKVSIHWGSRTKSIDAPGSALSAVITFPNASATNTNVAFSVDRSGPLAGSTVVYTGLEDIKSTATQVTVNFYGDTAAGGALVATASGAMTVQSDGTISTTISTEGRVNTVTVSNGQTMTVGETRALEFGARDAQNNLIAVSPGSASWSVSTGGDKLSFSNGDATGLAAGNAEVVATVDGKASAATTVVVTDPSTISVSVTPTLVSILPSATQQFTAQVTGTGNTAVTWSVVEAGGGTVTSSGSYTAPASTGSYTVKATSVANPAKSGTATVKVENINVSVSPLSATIMKGLTKQLTATVTGTTNQAVTWSVVQAGGGSVDTNGLYTAPNTLGTYTVRATSVANSAVKGDSSITVSAGTFTTISSGTELGTSPFSGPPNMSSDGQTLFVPMSTTFTGSSGAAMWTPGGGWFSFALPAPYFYSEARGISPNGQYFVGVMYKGNTPPMMHFGVWNRTGAFTPIWVDFQANVVGRRYVYGVSDDGDTVYFDDGQQNAKSYKISTNTYTTVKDQFTMACISADNLVIGGNAPDLTNGPIWLATVFSTAHNLEQPAGMGTNISFLAADGSAGIGNGAFWSRSGGVMTFPSNQAPAAMTPDGKTVVYVDNTRHDVYLWDAVKGERSLGEMLRSAAGNSSYDFVNYDIRVGGDGRYVSGSYRPISTSQDVRMFYATFPVAP